MAQIEKATVVAKPVAKKPASVKKPAAKSTAKKTADKKSAAKTAVKKAPSSKAASKKSAAKPAAKKSSPAPAKKTAAKKATSAPPAKKGKSAKKGAAPATRAPVSDEERGQSRKRAVANYRSKIKMMSKTERLAHNLGTKIKGLQKVRDAHTGIKGLSRSLESAINNLITAQKIVSSSDESAIKRPRKSAPVVSEETVSGGESVAPASAE
jgi:hypothetical protein